MGLLKRIETWVAVGVVTIIGATLLANRPDPRTHDENRCRAEAGENLTLCRIYHNDGLILEFTRPVTNAFFLFDGCAKIELWLRRVDIGNAEGSQVYEPIHGGIGIGITPGFVAARVTGKLVVIEDVVYAE